MKKAMKRENIVGQRVQLITEKPKSILFSKGISKGSVGTVKSQTADNRHAWVSFSCHTHQNLLVDLNDLAIYSESMDLESREALSRLWIKLQWLRDFSKDRPNYVRSEIAEMINDCKIIVDRNGDLKG